MDKLEKQLSFIIEIDKLKKILRRNHLTDGSRVENDAEHSWYFAITAIILSEYAKEEVDLLKVVKMALIHDIVEIDAGDTFVYDEQTRKNQEVKEEQAAKRLFYLLPDEQARELHTLWEEFEAHKSPESRYARAIDRFVALLMNYVSEGKTWRAHKVGSQQILAINSKINDGAPEIWKYAKNLIKEALNKGYLEN